MNYADAKRLGIGHLHPAATGQTDTEVLRRLGVEPVAPSPPKEPGDGMNKTERAFACMLHDAKTRSEIMGWLREPVKLRLAGRTWYTPDFVVIPHRIDSEPRLTFVEVKGFMRDDAAVKLKVAAETYPCFRWLLVRRASLFRDQWSVREVTRTGIGVHDIVVSWIGGGGA